MFRQFACSVVAHGLRNLVAGGDDLLDALGMALGHTPPG
jgi:hypothetical protein